MAVGFGVGVSGVASGARVKNGWSFLACGPSASAWAIVATSASPIDAADDSLERSQRIREVIGVEIIVCVNTGKMSRVQDSGDAKYCGRMEGCGSSSTGEVEESWCISLLMNRVKMSDAYPCSQL